MIRKLNPDEHITFSKKYIDQSKIKFLFNWFGINNFFTDIDWVLDDDDIPVPKSLWIIVLVMFVLGVLLTIIPTAGMSVRAGAMGKNGNKLVQIIAIGIVSLVTLIPLYLMFTPINMYTYVKFCKGNPLFDLISSD